ncbi:hypothetical protein BDN71DRAFT_467781 [Pleurotus eryngii]|uniref:Uncharacterized protein n=1 Tax=Pleurotus eryngii TaxID=5323 RepID=A0A9P5ZJ35_PLEER|nr:hypothetical protein BDN71DRAFT_467781 [Pleurotus eryngii]
MIGMCPNRPGYNPQPLLTRLLRGIKSNPGLRFVETFMFQAPARSEPFYNASLADVRCILPYLVNVKRLFIDFAHQVGEDHGIIALTVETPFSALAQSTEVLRIESMPSLVDLGIGGDGKAVVHHVVKASPSLRSLSLLLGPGFGTIFALLSRLPISNTLGVLSRSSIYGLYQILDSTPRSQHTR